MAKAGGARMIPQSQFTPGALARQVEALAADPEALANAAARSLSVGRPNAARDLANLVELIGGGKLLTPVGRAARAEAPVLSLSPAGAAA
jgi:UDP-N-acetylglucosamine--N-acetylmuramyl-(pentapeptide) pyrophosphoryl-undecaprenol N-acetylglucosamine transferase